MNFEKVYQENHGTILGYVTKRVHDTQVAEELTNDVFMRVHKHQNNFDPEKSALKTWVFNITNRILIDYYRVKKLKTQSLNQVTEDGESTADFVLNMSSLKSTTPHMEMVSKESIMLAQDAINNLPKKLKTVSHLFFIKNYKLDEICDEINAPLGTVKNNIFKARKILQKQLVRI